MNKINRISASYVADWYALSIPPDGVDSPCSTYCSIQNPEWYSDECWESEDALIVKDWLLMSDHINDCLHQVNRTYSIGQTEYSVNAGLNSSYKALRLLVKHNLIYLDVPAKPATSLEVFAFARKHTNDWEYTAESMQKEIISLAVEHSRWDILAAFEMPCTQSLP